MTDYFIKSTIVQIQDPFVLEQKFPFHLLDRMSIHQNTHSHQFHRNPLAQMVYLSTIVLPFQPFHPNAEA